MYEEPVNSSIDHFIEEQQSLLSLTPNTGQFLLTSVDALLIAHGVDFCNGGKAPSKSGPPKWPADSRPPTKNKVARVSAEICLTLCT